MVRAAEPSRDAVRLGHHPVLRKWEDDFWYTPPVD